VQFSAGRRRRRVGLSVRPLRAGMTGLVEGRLAITADWMSRALQGIDLVCRDVVI